MWWITRSTQGMAEDSPSEHEYQALEAALLNKSGSELLHNRFRALFTLKALKNDRAVDIISKGFAHRTSPMQS
jgi:deoxyhypusine monooxygenase